VIAENEDAQVLVYEENFEGMTAEEATKKIAELAVELGYLNEENHGVTVTAEGKIDADKLEESAQQSFAAAVQASGENFSVNVTADGLFSENRDVQMVNANLGLSLTVGEYQLILQAQAADGSLTIEAAAELPTEELLAIIYENVEEYVPYATEAYLQAKEAAFSAYYEAKEELLNLLWTKPYYTNFLQYMGKNEGMIYSMYAASSVLLESGIRATEAAVKVAENTKISEDALTAIAEKLALDEAATAAFKTEVKGEDGKATLAELDAYLNKYFKNMTEEERAAAQQVFDDVMVLAKDTAALVQLAVSEESKEAIEKLINDLEKEIPDSLKSIAEGYVAEFKGTIEKMAAAMNGKEPLPAAYGALKELEAAKARVLESLKNNLTEEDRASVEEDVANAEEQFASFEKLMNDTIARAEQTAKNYLAKLKAARKN
jgi:hypothetical protein